MLVHSTHIRSEESNRKQLSNVKNWAYFTLKKKASGMNSTFTKSVLADATLKYAEKPTTDYIGQKENQVDQRLKKKYGDDIVEKIEKLKTVNKSYSDLYTNVPENEDAEDTIDIELQLMPDTVEECLTGYADYKTLHESLKQSYYTPFKSRTDRLECKEQLLHYPDQETTHNVAKSILTNDNTIEGTEAIEITKEWYRQDDLTQATAEQRVNELGKQDKDKKLLALKHVCKDQIIDREGVVQTATRIFNCSTKTARNYADKVIRGEKAEEVINSHYTKKGLTNTFNESQEAKKAYKLIQNIEGKKKTEVKTLCNNRKIDYELFKRHIDYSPPEVIAWTENNELTDY